MTTPSDPRPTVPATTARLVSLASRAPSIANSQPWLWRTDGTTVELYADRSRRLPADDPYGRQLMVSCGAAAHHLEVAATALGLRPRVERVQVGPGERPLVARVVLGDPSAAFPAAEATEGCRTGPVHDVLATIRGRRTDRARFTTWPVPADRVASLARAAQRQGAPAVPVVDAVAKAHLSSLVLAAAGPAGRDGPRPADAAGDLEPTDGALVLVGGEDEDDWVTAGRGLSALWLAAARSGLGVVPLSAPVENDSTRRLLHHGLLEDSGTPVLVVRVSWAPMGRGHLSVSSRRPWHEVVEVVGSDARPSPCGDQGPRRLGAAGSPREARSAAQ